MPATDADRERHDECCKKLEGWRGELSEREQLQVEMSEFYADRFSPAGVPGHTLMMLVAKLARLLDGSYKS